MSTGKLYEAVRCNCGKQVCTDWHVEPVCDVWGVNFTEKQARAVAKLLNEMEKDDEQG